MKKNEKGRTYGTCRGGKKCTQGFGGKTWRNERPLGIDERILKWSSRKWKGGCGLDLSGSGKGQVEGSCECGNELSVSMKRGEFYFNIYPTRRNVTQFILSGNCSTCFGWHHHPSSGVQTTVSTASGIRHTVIAICCYRGRIGTGFSHLQHTQTSSNSSTIAADSNNGVTNARCCRYSCLRPWWWVVVPPETCRAVSR